MSFDMGCNLKGSNRVVRGCSLDGHSIIFMEFEVFNAAGRSSGNIYVDSITGCIWCCDV